MSGNPSARGGCLCGQVRYEVNGKLRNVVNCHCSKCRRFHGNFGAYTRVRWQDLTLIESAGLKWYRSTQDETASVERGFCGKCGSSLFWHPKESGYISVAAGSLDDTTHLTTIGHIWLSQMGDYYSIGDGLPQYQQGWDKPGEN